MRTPTPRERDNARHWASLYEPQHESSHGSDQQGKEVGDA